MATNTKKSIKIAKCSIKEGETLDIIIDGIKSDEEYNFSVNVSKIEDDHTFWAFETSSMVNNIDTDKQISFKIPEDYKDGLYLINHIALINKEKNIQDPLSPILDEDREILQIPVTSKALFEVIKDSDSPKSCSELKDQYDKIITNREKEFNKGFGNGLNEYLGLVFVRDCKLTIRMRLGRYEVIPFEGISCNDEISLIKSLLAENNLKLGINDDEILNKCKSEQPSFIIHFPKVCADSLNDAASKIKERSQLICDLLAVQRGARPSIIGMVLISLNNNESWFGLNMQSYGGNLLGGFLSGEDPQFLEYSIQKSENNEKIQLYFSLYNEANKEDRIEFKYFRLWNILETIARSKNYIGQDLLDWQGNIVKNTRGVNRKIQNDAKELVFELIREVFTSSSMSNSTFAMGLNQGLIDEMIPIWYRHRNCVVHGGGCFHDDPDFCKIDKDQWVNCKNAHDEIISVHGVRNSFNDGYLRALDDTVKKIIDFEIKL